MANPSLESAEALTETGVSIMGSKAGLTRKFMELLRDNKVDEAVAMLADDVVASNPMTGTQTGKAAVEAAIRNRAPGAWAVNTQSSEPEEEGDTVKIVGTGSPHGPIKIIVGFNASDQINRLDTGLV
jgi:hypothetical protein